MQCSVYIATSLDGFIARPDGDIDWLTAAGTLEEGEDYGYHAFMDTINALVMGRKTFEKVRSFESPWPYGDTRVIVMSRTDTSWPDLPSTVERFAGTPHELIDTLANEGLQRLYIDGGRLIQSFLRAGLITDLTITRIPVLIGAGIPLFGDLDADIALTHVNTTPYPNGLVQSIYEVAGR